jgi:hypothetical protein
MKFTPIAVTAAALGILGATTCLAQTASPPASTTSPSSASSESQREATSGPAAERSADPVDASSPHQRQVAGAKPQTMKQCMDAQAAKKSGMSNGQMTKSCNDQMKMQKDYEHLSEVPTTAPNKADGGRTPASK